MFSQWIACLELSLILKNGALITEEVTSQLNRLSSHWGCDIADSQEINSANVFSVRLLSIVALNNQFSF